MTNPFTIVNPTKGYTTNIIFDHENKKFKITINNGILKLYFIFKEEEHEIDEIKIPIIKTIDDEDFDHEYDEDEFYFFY